MSDYKMTLDDLRAHLAYCFEPGVRIIGNTTAGEIIAAIDAGAADNLRLKTEVDEWRAIATRDITAERGSMSATLGDRYAVMGPGAYAHLIAHSQKLEQERVRLIKERDSLHSALGAALALTYVPTCSQDEGWANERVRIQRIFDGEEQ